MTKTQLNRTTIFIMNLWVNRVRQLALFAVALFFFSCKDEVNLLGYKNPNSKFDVKFIELPLESSVLLDSVRTSNFFFSTETNRLLIGKYSDEKFGEISSSAATQFFTTTTTKLASSADYDSVSIQFRFDYYTYGASKTASDQEIYIYELDQELNDALRSTYFSNTPIVTKPKLLGQKKFSVNPTEFQKYLDDQKDTVRTVRMKLDYDFGKDIFDVAIKYRDAASVADSAFINYTDFVKKFYGIAIVPNSGDKLFGFSPVASASKITLHYHTTTDTLELNLSFVNGQKIAGKVVTPVNLINYNNIASNRAATELAGLSQYHQDFEPADERRYIQSGTGIVTKIDMSKFLEFSDTIPNMILNSAELVIGDVVDGAAFDPPGNLVMRVLKENNNSYAFGTKNSQAVKDYSLFKGFIIPEFNSSPFGVVVDNDSTFTAVGDQGAAYAQLVYSKVGKKYNSYITRFLQQVYIKDENKTQLQYFGLYQAPSFGKSVNRVIFPKNNIKLRIYYTLPTVKD